MMHSKMMITRSKRRKAMTTTTNLTPCLSQDLIFYDILPRLPAKSLLKFTCVSKLWYNWIHDPNFIASHYNLSKSNPSLIAISIEVRAIRFMYLDQRDQGGVSSPILDLPKTCIILVIGSINCLTCIRTGCYIEICNSSTREMLQIPFPKVRGCGISCYGFGFDPSVNEYKILRIINSTCKIYTVGAGLNGTQDCIWRDITVTSALPQEWDDSEWDDFEFAPFLSLSGVLVKVISNKNLIITFDIHCEKFQVIPGAPLCCDQSYLNSKFHLYSMFEFQECPYIVYCTDLEEGYEFHLYALKQQQQQQSSKSCWLIKGCSHFVFKQAICIPFNPLSRLIHFIEFLGQILLVWFSIVGLIKIYNPHTRCLQEISGLSPHRWTYNFETVLFARHIDNLHFLRTMVPLLPLGAPQFKYVSSREAMHGHSSTQESKRYRPSAEER